MKKKIPEKKIIDTSWVEGTVLDEAEFDLDGENNAVKGIFVLAKEGVFVKKDETITKYAFEDIEKIDTRSDFGVFSYELELKTGEIIVIGHATAVIAKTMTNVARGAMDAITNPESLLEYKKREDLRCPKCGRPLRPGKTTCDKCYDKSGVLKRLIKLVMPHKFGVILAVLVYFLTLGINLVEPYINKILVDDFIKNPDITEPMTVLVPFILTTLLLLVAYFLTWLVGFVRSMIMMKMGISAIVDIRKKLYDKVQKLSIGRVEQKTTGEIMKRISGDANHVQDFVATWAPNFIGQVLLLVAVCFVLAFYANSINIGWQLLLIFVVPLPITIVAIILFHRKTRKIYGRQWEASSKTDSILHDILSGIRVVKAYGTEARENVRYSEAAAFERDLSIKNEVLFAKLQPFIRMGLRIGNFMLLYFTATKILNGQLTIGECTMFTTYINMVYEPLFWLASFPSRMARTLTSANRIFELIDEQEDMITSNNDVVKDIEGTIEFKNVTFGYEPTRQILKNVNLTIKPGEMVGLVGRSGAGKTTMTNLMMRLYDVDSGHILVDGVDIKNYNQECYRGQIGAVLQETILFSDSLYQNLVYAKPEATLEEVLACSKAAGVHDFAVKLPDGYNTRIGEKGYTLSGGERQRVAIARAILRDPKILILDEATSSLDTEMEKQIQDAIEVLIKDRTTIAIAHRLSTLRNATKIVVIDDGKIAEVGSHDELIAKRGMYYELVLAQRATNSVKG